MTALADQDRTITLTRTPNGSRSGTAGAPPTASKTNRSVPSEALRLADAEPASAGGRFLDSYLIEKHPTDPPA